MTHKIVSQLNADGYLIGPSFAYESPLERGVFLIPAGAVDMPPPEVPADQWCKLVDGDWVFGDIVAEVSQQAEEVHLQPVEKLKQFLASNPDVVGLLVDNTPVVEEPVVVQEVVDASVQTAIDAATTVDDIKSAMV